ACHRLSTIRLQRDYSITSSARPDRGSVDAERIGGVSLPHERWGSPGRGPKLLMSGSGHKRTKRHLGSMSALPPKADKRETSPNVRFVPKADSCTAAKRSLFNHLTGTRCWLRKNCGSTSDTGRGCCGN